MLTLIRVHNFAIIDSLSLKFGPGLNIVTGETGSGKSLLIKSLSLLMGEKSNADFIKQDATEALVEGHFNLSHRPDIFEKMKHLSLLGDDPESLIVRRVIQKDKTKIFINDNLVTLNTLKQLVFPLVDLTSRSSPLIEITGQFENKNLLNKHFHLEMLDHYCPPSPEKELYFKGYQELIKLNKELSDLNTEVRESKKQIDYLSFQFKEIQEAQLNIDEDHSLETKIRILKSNTKLQDFFQLAQVQLGDHANSLLPQLKLLLKKQTEILQISPDMGTWFQQLEQCSEQLIELNYQIEQKMNTNEDIETSLDQSMARLSLIRKLQKKYGSNINDILIYQSELKAKIDRIENFEHHHKQLQAQQTKLTHQLTLSAQKLHQVRTQYALKLSDQINSHLKDLNMKGVEFYVEILLSTELGPWGLSDVEFKANLKGQPSNQAKPLHKIASGGELSRILLALKVVVGNQDYPRTYLFDEVDTGVSGLTAESVGKKLYQVAQHQQVICVTHLPQVAAFGNQHFIIEKHPDLQSKVQAFAVTKEARIQELARLVSGAKITPTSLKHAKELLKTAQQTTY